MADDIEQYFSNLEAGIPSWAGPVAPVPLQQTPNFREFHESLAQKFAAPEIAPTEDEHKASFIKTVLAGASQALADLAYSGAGRTTSGEAEAMGAPEMWGVPRGQVKQALEQKEYNMPIPTPDWYKTMNPQVGETIPAGLAREMAAIYGIPARMQTAQLNLEAQKERETQRMQFRREMAEASFQRQRDLFYEKTGVSENNKQANDEVEMVRKASTDYAAKLDAISSIRALLAQGSKNADKQAGGALASVYNKGRLSDFDYKIATQAGSIIESLKQGIDTLSGKGGFTPDQRKELLRTADALEAAIERRRIEMWDEAAARVATIRKVGGGAEAATAANRPQSAGGVKPADLRAIVAAELAKEGGK